MIHTPYFFFFQYYREHRDLHSFPTRRSSDLKAAVEKMFPDSAYQLTHNALFPKDCIHIENLGGEIDAPELQNKRLIVGCFPWKFKGGEAAFCRTVAFMGEWKI